MATAAMAATAVAASITTALLPAAAALLPAATAADATGDIPWTGGTANPAVVWKSARQRQSYTTDYST